MFVLLASVRALVVALTCFLVHTVRAVDKCEAWPDFSGCAHRWQTLLAEGVIPTPREWHTALGLQDCMVVVGGREDIQEYEPIAISCDTMATSVEILWVRQTAARQLPSGERHACNPDVWAGEKGA